MSYVENRVYVKNYVSLAVDSPLLVPVPTAPGHGQQKLHMVAAGKLTPMAAAVEQALGFPLLGASGWRQHRWDSYQQWVDFITAKYGSFEEGRLYLAFASAHETGLALDMGCGGLSPVSATIAAQEKTPLFKWLMDHASEYGFTPYKVEPWHWECNIPKAEFDSGLLHPEQSTSIALNDVCADNRCVEAPLDSEFVTRA